jgi:hypothetical protein
MPTKRIFGSEVLTAQLFPVSVHTQKQSALKRKYLLSLLLLLIFTHTTAQELKPRSPKNKEMNVDMPDETEEADVIEKESWQLETAFLYNKFQEGRPSAIGKALLRYGLLESMELRLLAEDGRQRDRYFEETVQGNAPLAVGARVLLLKDHKWLPDIAGSVTLKLPFTSRTQEQEAYWSPKFLIAFQHQFGEKVKLEYNTGIQQKVFSYCS